MSWGASLALASRLAVSVVLAAAAGAKVGDRAGVRRQLAVSGVPPGLVPAVGVLLPATELAVAVLLVAFPFSAAPAWLAVALLATFTVVVIGNLGRGRRDPCPCFGAPGASATPISGRTVVRNGWLVALAVAATGSARGADPLATVVLAAVLGAVTVLAVRAG
ncbi:MAG: hypothetical protein M5U14_17350 [Acidimicrobiia bacterium]|nr:hypothetical protein [Acidimicrobiia bacterium]